jgi:hypothetical protein
MNISHFRQKRIDFFVGICVLHVAFTRAVYRRVRPCTNTVYLSVYVMPAKSGNKASKFPNMTRAMARKHRPAKAFLLPFSLR